MLRMSLAALAFLAATHAAAADGPQPVEVRIWRADLDLSTEEGARILLRRLAGSAREACAHVESPMFPRARAYAYRCRRKVIERALASLNEAEVNRTYAALVARGGLAELTR
ncbi:UrcA family protein [Phenylobacterium sp.]|uniref:UrcA family protein n=1 Tax=Phenylobacterium sp. TaxID=1871053 RepID=UPI002B9A0E6B|nr:UrcA family protein [Phenylobacterium sp.]HVI34210.1 UrcA family protein [Phenylobacterium sp.]